MLDKSCYELIEALATKAPVPGGGGASALVGAIGAALGSMVGNLTVGKKKYADVEEDVRALLIESGELTKRLSELVQADAEVFEPLAAAYGIPKEDPSRVSTLEHALFNASLVPMEILAEVTKVVDIIEELSEKGSKLAISDVAVAAAACRCALDGAVMNVYINTKLMNDKTAAIKLNKDAEQMVNSGTARCTKVYNKILDELR
jgi:formiminotetrahydrofolate cyclodeaminase